MFIVDKSARLSLCKRPNMLLLLVVDTEQGHQQCLQPALPPPNKNQQPAPSSVEQNLVPKRSTQTNANGLKSGAPVPDWASPLLSSIYPGSSDRNCPAFHIFHLTCSFPRAPIPSTPGCPNYVPRHVDKKRFYNTKVVNSRD